MKLYGFILFSLLLIASCQMEEFWDGVSNQLLRESFPGRDEEFYEYGKWSGGAYNSERFKSLSIQEQKQILSYIIRNGL